jgi:hypothetical protein
VPAAAQYATRAQQVLLGELVLAEAHVVVAHADVQGRPGRTAGWRLGRRQLALVEVERFGVLAVLDEGERAVLDDALAQASARHALPAIVRGRPGGNCAIASG